MNDPVLKPGVALVLAGPQGCGKTTLARRIANLYGRFVEIDALQLEYGAGVNDALQTAPRVIIIEGLPRSEAARDRLKLIATSQTVHVRPAFSVVRKAIRAPHLIVCTHEHVPAAFTESSSFQVINMPERATA